MYSLFLDNFLFIIFTTSYEGDTIHFHLFIKQIKYNIKYHWLNIFYVYNMSQFILLFGVLFY